MPMTIEQQAGRKRKVSLDGRGLPFADSVEWGGEQRMEDIWLPGSPHGIAQVFGPKEYPQSLRGRWGDRYMMGDSPACAFIADGKQVTTALDAAHYMDTIRKEGILLRVGYDAEVRYGILRDFKYRPFAQGRTLERIDWDMRFTWLSDGELPQLPTIPTKLGVQDFATRVTLAAQKIEDVLNHAANVADNVLTTANAPIVQIRLIAGAANDLVSAWVSRAADAASTARGAIGLAAELGAQAIALRDAISSTAGAEIQGLTAAGESVRDLNQIGASMEAERNLRDLRREADAMLQLAYEAQIAAEENLYDVRLEVAYTMKGEDLRDVARRVLNDGARWRDIAMLNGLSGSEVDPGMALLLPR